MNRELDQAKVAIRVGHRADLDAILVLARRCDLLEPGIAEAVERFLVASASGGVVGVCGLEKYDGFGLLRTLGVAPDYRGSGLGRRLVEMTLARGRAEGVRTIFLPTTTAREFFARRGFDEAPRGAAPDAIRESWEFKSGCPTSATLMLKEV